MVQNIGTRSRCCTYESEGKVQSDHAKIDVSARRGIALACQGRQFFAGILMP